MATTSLEDRIAVLETLVAELRAQLEQPPRRDSMMKTFIVADGENIIEFERPEQPQPRGEPYR